MRNQVHEAPKFCSKFVLKNANSKENSHSTTNKTKLNRLRRCILSVQ